MQLLNYKRVMKMSPKLRIDDEDVEIIEDDHEDALKKVLKFKISWLKILRVILILFIAGTIIYFIVAGGFPSDIFVYVLLFVCIVGAAVLIAIDDEDEDNKLTLSVLKCRNCSDQKIQRFADGDFVFQLKGKCSKCDGDLQIIEIYSVKLKEEMEEKNAETESEPKTEP